MSVYAAMVFSFLSFAVAIPSAVKVFNWTATLYRGAIWWQAPLLFVFGFIGLFTIGGLTGLFVASLGIDVHVHDTYFVVAHFHYIMVGGAIMGYLGGLHYWWPKITGKLYPRFWSRISAMVIFIGFNVTFFPMHWIGLQGMPRRVADYSDEFGNWNFAISIASFALGASTVVFLYNMIVSWRRGPRAPGNPWRGLTLEWQVSSPPPVFNFDEIPQVVGSPYEYGVRGARHAVTNGDRAQVEEREKVQA